MYILKSCIPGFAAPINHYRCFTSVYSRTAAGSTLDTSPNIVGPRENITDRSEESAGRLKDSANNVDDSADSLEEKAGRVQDDWLRKREKKAKRIDREVPKPGPGPHRKRWISG